MNSYRDADYRGTSIPYVGSASMTIEIDKSIHLVRITLEGDLSLQDIVDTFHEMLKHPDFCRDMNSLWDFSHASLRNLSGEDIRQLESTLRQFGDVRRGIMSACVCPDVVSFRLARMYEMMSEWSTTARFKVFDRMEDAHAWMSSSVRTDPTPASTPN